MSKFHGKHSNPNQKLKTKIPSKNAIESFFCPKGNKSENLSKRSASSGDFTEIGSSNAQKRQKLTHSGSSFGTHSTFSSSSSRSSPVETLKENLSPIVVLDSFVEEITLKPREYEVVAEDIIDDACLMAVATEDSFQNLDIEENWEITEPTDIIRGKISSINRNCDAVDIKLTEGMLPVNAQLRVQLGGYWSEQPLQVDDLCHIIMDEPVKLSNFSKICVDDDHLFILHPDTLVSATSLVGSLNCVRQTVLNDKFPFPSVYPNTATTTKPMLLGSAVHELFQWAIQLKAEKRMLDTQMLIDKLNLILSQPGFLQDLFSIKEKVDTIVNDIKLNYIPSILQFSTTQIGDLSAVRDIEENVWSPRFGVKGKIDASIQLISRGKKLTVPLELKTGQASKSREHFGQAMLYSLLLADRYGAHDVPEFGLLSYLKNGNKDSQCIKVTRVKPAIQGLLQTRNELAHYLAKPWVPVGTNLPPPIANDRTCAWCPQQLNCALNLRLDPDASSKTVSVMISSLSATFSEFDFAFWLKWTEILNVEFSHEQSVEQWLRKFWSLSLEEMESSGSTVGHLVISNACQRESHNSCEADCVLEFTRKISQFPLPEITCSSASPFSETFSADENFRPRMLISSGLLGDRKFIGFCFGTLLSVKSDGEFITYSLVAEKNFKKLYPNVTEYRLDVVSSSFSNGFSYKMGISNLTTLYDPPHQNLRSLILGQRPPRHAKNLRRDHVDKLSRIPSLTRLTRQQKRIVLSVLKAEDCILVRGYPGTGKSTTISVLIKALITLGQTVILSAYTNTAVDSILTKLVAMDEFQGEGQSKILRIGPLDRINPDLHQLAERNRLSDVETLEQLTELYEKPVIVAGTCHALFGHTLFSRRKFSICLIDEASQTLLPISLGPLFCAEKFVLVGDPNQLGPLVVNATKECSGVKLSLLELLLSHCSDPEIANFSVCDLTEQFRMNEEILRIPNRLYYDDRLTCAEASAKTTLHLPMKVSIESSMALQKLLSNRIEDSVSFFNTAELKVPLPLGQKPFTKTSNFIEAFLVSRLVELLVKRGRFSFDEIGVISPYTEQVKRISRLLEDECRISGIEVNTVDQYQGREKSIIFLTFVKAGEGPASLNEKTSKSGILADGKRLNVALTRSRHKLVLVGSRDYLTSSFHHVADVVAMLRPDQMMEFSTDDFNCLVKTISARS